MTFSNRALDGSSQDVITTLNYYDDPGDGSQPEPVYVKKYIYL